MLKIIGILILSCMFSISCFAQHVSKEHESEEEDFEHHSNFEESSLTIGIGVPYSTAINQIGINLRMYFNIGEHICFGPEYSYFRNDEYEIVDFDLIGHYIFETPIVGIYPLFGVNYTVETDRVFDDEVEEEFGLIYGLGVHRNVAGVTFFAEYSRVEFGIDDQFVTGGVMYTFK